MPDLKPTIDTQPPKSIRVIVRMDQEARQLLDRLAAAEHDTISNKLPAPPDLGAETGPFTRPI